MYHDLRKWAPEKVNSDDGGVYQPYLLQFVNAEESKWIDTIYAAETCDDVKYDEERGGEVHADPSATRTLYASGARSGVPPGDDRIGPSWETGCIVVRLAFEQAELARLLAQASETSLIANPLRLRINASVGWAESPSGFEHAAVSCALGRMLANENTPMPDGRYTDNYEHLRPLDPYEPFDTDYLCRGALNRTAAAEDFCGRWAVTRNTDGLTEEAQQKLKAPTCMAAPRSVLEDARTGGPAPVWTSQPCPGWKNPRKPSFDANLSTTHVGGYDPRVDRAGMYELNHWNFRDYCGHYQLFRAQYGSSTQVDNITACRHNVANATRLCNTTDCVPCRPRCTMPAVSTVRDIWDCMTSTTSHAQLWCERNTDQAPPPSPPLVRRPPMWHLTFAPSRSQGRYYTGMHNGVPDSIFQEHARSCVYNPDGYVARKAISCRRPNTFAGVATSEPDQEKRLSAGYIVPCQTDSDCREVCPSHFITQQPYVCMKPFRLYGAPRAPLPPAPLRSQPLAL